MIRHACQFRFIISVQEFGRVASHLLFLYVICIFAASSTSQRSTSHSFWDNRSYQIFAWYPVLSYTTLPGSCGRREIGAVVRCGQWRGDLSRSRTDVLAAVRLLGVLASLRPTLLSVLLSQAIRFQRPNRIFLTLEHLEAQRVLQLNSIEPLIFSLVFLFLVQHSMRTSRE